MNLRQVSLLQIDSFLAVAKYLNFTEAAKNLYITQPSLSKQISVFEKEIGMQLFVRTKRSVRLTPAGAILYQELKGIVDSINHAFEKAKQPELQEDLNLTIGILEAMDNDVFLPQMIETFQKKHPNINLAFERHGFRPLREKLLNGQLDVIFTLSFEVNDSLGVIWDPIYQMNTDILMSIHHPLAARDYLKLEELRDEKFISISREESPRGYDAVIDLCKRHGFSPNIVKQLPNIESLLLCIEAGLGVFLFDANVHLNHEERFKRYPLNDDFISVVAAWKKENLNPAISMFLEGYHLD